MSTRNPRTAIDFATRDSRAQLSTNVMITRRHDVPLDVFYDYWSDIHGVMAARADGVADYWQHRLGDPIVDFFPPMPGIDQRAPVGDPIVGLAEITFADAAGRAALIASAAVGQMVIDEQNVLKGTYLFSSAPGNAVTLVDRLVTNAPQGALEGYGVLIFVRQAQTTSVEGFRHFILSELGDSFSKNPFVRKARVHLLEAYDSAGWPTPNVDHRRSAEQQYQAFFELVFESADTATRAVRSEDFRNLTTALAHNVSALTTYGNSETYTLVYDGRPTQAGLRGLSAYRTLRAVGEPANEKSRDVLKLIFGEAVLEPTS